MNGYDLNYSVAIRTLGNAGDKYVRTIRSVLAQSIAPQEVIVVIPYGYELNYMCGKERIVRCAKGMVTQRAAGINEVKSEYILVIDDDVELESDFVQKSWDYLMLHGLDCVLPGRTTSKIHFSHYTRLKGFIRGNLFTSNKSSQWQDVIVKTSGHKVYVNSCKPDKCYLCQTGCFQCFFMKTDAAKNVHLEDELWLEQGKVSKYAIMDDTVFFYKAYLGGYKTAYCFASYVHLDAAAGRTSRTKLEERIIRYYTDMKNHYIFWRRFIYDKSSSLLDRVTARFSWWHFLIGYSLWTVITNIWLPRYWKAISAMINGYKDGKTLYCGLV